MSAGDLTLLDLRNILKWHELISEKKDSSEEQHVRTKIKIQGFRITHEDSSEQLIDNLTEEISSKFNDANFSELQQARSLLANRTTRINEEIKVYSELIQKVNDKMEELS